MLGGDAEQPRRLRVRRQRLVGDEAQDRAATATETATPEPSKPARSAQECFELWNAHEELGTAGQTAPADYLADLAPTPAAVVFADGECLVIAPIRGRRNRAYVWVAPRGQAPFGHPSQQDVGELDFNARGRKDGKLEPAA
jgi:hypothetical protein